MEKEKDIKGDILDRALMLMLNETAYNKGLIDEDTKNAIKLELSIKA